MLSSFAQQLRQRGNIRRNPPNGLMPRRCDVRHPRISYKHRIIYRVEKMGEKMDARAVPQVDFDDNKVRALVAKYLGVDAKRVTDEAHFREDFDLDSLDQLELLILIEEEFHGAEFSDAAVSQIEVVGDLIRYLEINYLLGNLYAQTFRRSAA
jgi:acyl carrier protein